MNDDIFVPLFFLPLVSRALPLPRLSALLRLSFPFFLFPLRATYAPVSRTLDKYLHEFRATARKLERERERERRGHTLKFFRAVPWLAPSLSLAPSSPLHYPRSLLRASRTTLLISKSLWPRQKIKTAPSFSLFLAEAQTRSRHQSRRIRRFCS